MRLHERKLQLEFASVANRTLSQQQAISDNIAAGFASGNAPLSRN